MTQELSLRQLRRIALESGIQGWQRMNKDAIVASLADQERERMVHRFADIYERLFPVQAALTTVEYYATMRSALSGQGDGIQQ